ncbi:hypothetical protein FQN60_012188 [Etheostoma spectabile]|uniref:Clathrin light chain n=1 Tax=Etheostoma spectabile TaxID=54343 RepID=A0A5J5DPC9_9PERO|nr:hypothetical protein FQN60_012188 [Etheostoma spectabile]
MDDFDMLNAPAAGNGVGSEEDPAAAFLAQQESEIAGIENDEGFSILDSGEVPSSFVDSSNDGAVNGELHVEFFLAAREAKLMKLKESNGPSDAYAAISNENSRKQESEWKEKAKVELEEWHARQNEQLEKTKTNNRVLDEDFYKQPFSELIGYVAAEEAMISDLDENDPGTEWERVARLCDFNPKSSKQAKDVSRMRSVLISLKQSPLVR